jgi:hypothetical protein
VHQLTSLSLVALQSGGTSHPWASGYVLSLLIIGLASIFTWMLWEWKYARFPMVPREMFQGQRVVGLAFFVAFVAGLNFYSIINFLPLSFAAVYDPNPIQVGLKGLGYGISTTVGAVFFNALVSTRIEARWILLTGATLMTSFGGALIASNPTNPKLTVILSTLAAFGIGGILVPAATVALIVVPDSLLATTAALSLSVRTVGGSIGYTIYLNIFTKKLATKLPALVASYALSAGLQPNDASSFVTTFLTAPANITSAAGYTPEIAAAATIGSRWAYAESLKWVWVTSIPFGVCAIVACCFMPNIKKWQTNRIAAAI